MALAGSHYIFIKEIPIGSEYTMETRAIGWGEKWYVSLADLGWTFLFLLLISGGEINGLVG